MSGKAEELANDADLRMMPPRKPKQASTNPVNKTAGDDRLPLPGTVLTREYKGATIEVHVRRNGFEFEGVVYKSLSAAAKAITGSHCNGFLFFRLGKYGGQK